MNALLRSHPYLYHMLNDELYYDNVRNHDASALFWAASSGSMMSLQRLIDAGANVQWDSTYQWFEHEFQRKNQPNAKKHPISSAAINGHVEIVAKLIELGVDIDYKDPAGRSPLSLAARGGHVVLVQMLVAKGADLLSLDADRLHPMDHAAIQGHQEVEDLLFQEVRKLVDTEHRSKSLILKRHLHWMLRCAAERGDEDRVQFLLTQEGVDVNFVPLQGDLVPPAGSLQPVPWGSYTPLIGALQSAPDPMRMARILLENGADPNIITAIRDPSSTDAREGIYENPVSAALGRDQRYSLIELLLEYDLNALNSEMTLVKAMHLKKTAEFRLLVENGAYYTPEVSRIGRFGYQPIMDILVERGVQFGFPIIEEQNFEAFDFDSFLYDEHDSGFGFPIDASAALPPSTETPWANYLNTYLNTYPYRMD